MLGQVAMDAGANRLLMLVPELFWPAIGERIKGIREAIRKQGGKAELRIVTCGDGEFRGTQAALAQDLDAHGLPDAILAGNDHRRGQSTTHFFGVTGAAESRQLMRFQSLPNEPISAGLTTKST